jgi:hypothetical protein
MRDEHPGRQDRVEVGQDWSQINGGAGPSGPAG